MFKRFLNPIGFSLFFLTIVGCTPDNGTSTENGKPLFTKRTAKETGISFENRLSPTKEFNIFTYRNYHNGGGVGIGDFNGDGKQDLFLTANQRSSRLYLNEDKLRFKDITQQAGVGVNKGWATGVAIADVNADGKLDIYVCNAGDKDGEARANQLFINQGNNTVGIPTFTEQAAQYGIADQGATTHAAFFDYDLDGDLDLYVLNNSFRPVSSFGLRNIRHERNEVGGHKLYRNEGNNKFKDVSSQAGIFGSEIAFGLGVTVGDVNRDGWPDIYVSNDFFERDYFYINQKNGTFSEELEAQMPSLSMSSMGADMADLNNDAYPEIFVTDMLPEDDLRLKTTTIFETWDVRKLKIANGYWNQFTRNALQLNNKNNTFSEISQLTKTDATDWSWGALMADFDLDGHKDIFVCNGVFKDVTNQDFLEFFQSEAVVREFVVDQNADFRPLLDKIPSRPLPNYLFRNDGNLNFRNVAKDWGLADPSFSNGAAYADFDGDGDLDLVVNNLNEPAAFYENNARTLDQNNFLQLQFEGEAGNLRGIGAQATAYAKGQQFYLENIPQRGFQSSVDEVMTFGLGKIQTIDSLRVDWPNGKSQVLTQVTVNQKLRLKQKDAQIPTANYRKNTITPYFQDITTESGLDFTHIEGDYSDFDRELLLHRMQSTDGPRMAVGDVNGDGHEDVYLGGAKDQSGALFFGTEKGFRKGNNAPFQANKAAEEVAALFFDADKDQDIDLYVVTGSSEFGPDQANLLEDLLYLNDGNGNFTRASGRIPARYDAGSCVTAADYDLDGDQDLFVGSRVIPGQYGVIPKSALLRNDGKGYFTDITADLAPELEHVGMVTDAHWLDLDGDKRLDLLVVGDWMPITAFVNKKQGFKKTAVSGLENTSGWWNRMVVEDTDGDGDQDLLLGNWGWNSLFGRSTPEHPIEMYVGDLDQNGVNEQILAYYKPLDQKTLPFALRGDLARQMPSVKSKFLKYEDFANKTVQDIFPAESLKKTTFFDTKSLTTTLFENVGGGQFRAITLPIEAQISPVFALAVVDFDQDGIKDLILGGNLRSVKPQIGEMTAGYGTVLKGIGKNKFMVLPNATTGLNLTGEVRDIRKIGRTIVVSRSHAKAVVLAVRNSKNPL